MRPLRNITPAPRPNDISITSVSFKDLLPGHEGPDYFTTKRAPQRDAREIAEAHVYGQEAIGMIRFEMIGEAGQLLGVAAAVRKGRGVDDGNYYLRVPVPAQPFRFHINGRDVSGKAFSRLDRRLYHPGDQPAPTVAGAGRELDALFDAALRDDPEGWVRIPRTEVTEASYKLLAGAGGHPIGMRLHLAVRFGAPGAYPVRPHVFPLYANTDWRGAVTLKVLDGEVAPAPRNTAADALSDVIRYGGVAQYEPGVEYRFQFDLIPGYVIRNKAGTRYCVNMEEFRASGRLPLWAAIAASSAPVRYRVDLSGLGFNADTEPVAPQRTFYEGFLSEGAADCGPAPNINF